eukprot:2254970-Rhodomonas_salina.1
MPDMPACGCVSRCGCAFLSLLERLVVFRWEGWGLVPSLAISQTLTLNPDAAILQGADIRGDAAVAPSQGCACAVM